MHKKVKIEELFESLPVLLRELFEGCVYPWEVLPRIKSYVNQLLENPPAGYTLLREGILVGEGVSVAATATLEGPCVIGAGTEIRPGAYLRGSVITGEGCVIGNSTELKNCVLMDRVQVPHYNYVGDSVLGNFAHMGAGSVCSNLKADKKAVVIRGDEEYETGLRKVGAFLGDGADVGCGCVLNPGVVIGQRSSVYPLTSLRGVVPSDCIVKSAECVVKRQKQ